MRRALFIATAAAAVLAFAAPARAAEADGWGDGVEVMDDADMAEARGGIRVNGIDVGFGAVITTYANGVRALETRLTWTDTGPIVTEALGNLGQRLDSLSPEQRAQLGLEGVTGGVVIDDADGVTALAHNITKGSLQNIIVNNASGRDLAQDVDVTITLPSFAEVQHGFTNELFGLRVTTDLANMLAGSGH